ncbi:MAG: hypothetical protein N2253_01825 [Bacteroidia bacterium]|nr:hypothetical protein [Bacteroidia bacterium]
MIFVLGSVLTNVLLLLWLRLLRVPVPALVTLNYFVCVALAALIAPPSYTQIQAISPTAFAILGILGVLFVSVFILTGIGAREMGIGLTGMLTKLSVILPIGFAALFLGEKLTPLQGYGLLAGLGAIVAIHVPYLQGGGLQKLWQAARLGLLLWLGNGVIDILFKAFQPRWSSLSPLQIPLFIMSVAGLLGVGYHVLQRQAHQLLRFKVFFSALLLGSTNLLSIYFYLQGLARLPAVQFFLWNNLGIVLLSGLLGIVFFREKMSWAVGIGYGLGITAILLTA